MIISDLYFLGKKTKKITSWIFRNIANVGI
jgi:hypothetical protein